MSATNWLIDFGSLLLVHLWETTLVLAPLFLLARLADGWFRRLPTVWQSRIWHLALLKILVPASGIAFLLNKVVQIQPRSPAGELLMPESHLTIEMQRVWSMPREMVSMAETPDLQLNAAVWGLAGLWTVGTALALFRWLKMFQQTKRIAHSPGAQLIHTEERRWKRLLADCDIPVENVRLVEKSTGPMAVGWLRPVILIPVSLFRHLDNAELATILLHEKGHCQRRDPLRIMVFGLIEAPLFFYPPLAMTLKRLGECAEFSCDEWALTGADNAQTYLRALAGLVMPRPKPQPLTSALTGNMDSQFRRRLLRLDPSERRPLMLKNRLALGAVLTLLLIGTVLPVALADDPPPPPPPAKSAPETPKSVPAQPAPPAPPASPENGEQTHPPRLIEMVSPVYPPEAVKEKIQGTVVVEILVGPKGNVLEVEAISGPEILVEPSLVAARHCTFEAGKRNGKPMKAKLALPIKYSLD